MSHAKRANFVIIRHQDKEQRLREFIGGACVAARSRQRACWRHEPVLLIARSIGSPVSRALLAKAREGILDRPVLAVLTCFEGEDVPATWIIRRINDARFVEAHEQLVLSATASWIGDCMRRDPSKRDAYENFVEDCPASSDWARRSFNRVWNCCTPIEHVGDMLSPSLVKEGFLKNKTSEVRRRSPQG